MKMMTRMTDHDDGSLPPVILLAMRLDVHYDRWMHLGLYEMSGDGSS